MTREENIKRLKDKGALLDENEMIEGKKAYDYYNEQPYFQEKLRKAKELLRNYPPPGVNPDDILD